MFLFSLLFIIFLGAVLGSFATALRYRLLNNQSWIYEGRVGAARSRCPNCQHQLSVFDLVPLLSWFFLRGRCRYCHEAISPQYVYMEIGCALSAVFIYFIFGLSAETVLLLVLLPFVVTQIILFVQNKFISVQLWFIMVCMIFLYTLWEWS